MVAISIIVIGFCIISAVQRYRYQRETARMQSRWNAIIDNWIDDIEQESNHE